MMTVEDNLEPFNATHRFRPGRLTSSATLRNYFPSKTSHNAQIWFSRLWTAWTVPRRGEGRRDAARPREQRLRRLARRTIPRHLSSAWAAMHDMLGLGLLPQCKAGAAILVVATAGAGSTAAAVTTVGIFGMHLPRITQFHLENASGIPMSTSSAHDPPLVPARTTRADV